MKSSITILFLFCCAAVSFAQRVPSSCDAPDSVTEKIYYESVAKMAYEFMFKKDSSYADSSNASQSLRDTLLRAMNAVYNSGLESAKEVTGRINFASDQIDNFYGGSIFIEENYYSFRKIRVNIDSSVPWERNLLKMIVPTGNSTVDNFLTKHGLTIDTVNSALYQSTILWLQTDSLQNTLPIAKAWNDITGNTTNAMPENYRYYWDEWGGGR